MHTLTLAPRRPNVAQLRRPRMWHSQSIKLFFPPFTAFLILKNKCIPSPKQKASIISHFFVNIPTPNPCQTAATLVCSIVASWTTIFRLTLSTSFAPWSDRLTVDHFSAPQRLPTYISTRIIHAMAPKSRKITLILRLWRSKVGPDDSVSILKSLPDPVLRALFSASCLHYCQCFS